LVCGCSVPGIMCGRRSTVSAGTEPESSVNPAGMTSVCISVLSPLVGNVNELDPESWTESSVIPWALVSVPSPFVDTPLGRFNVLSVANSDSGRLSELPSGRPVNSGALASPVGKLGIPVTSPPDISFVTVMVTEAIVTVEAGAVTLKVVSFSSKDTEIQSLTLLLQR